MNGDQNSEKEGEDLQESNDELDEDLSDNKSE